MKPANFETSASKTIMISCNINFQTPDFPSAFPLPLECYWILDNSAPSSDDDDDGDVLPRSHLHLYFTQFYLSPGFLSLSAHDSMGSALRWARTGTGGLVSLIFFLVKLIAFASACKVARCTLKRIPHKHF